MYDLYHIDLSKLNGNISREQEVNMKTQKESPETWGGNFSPRLSAPGMAHLKNPWRDE